MAHAKKEDWVNSKWRPVMGWMYMLVCTMDFVGFPILWSLLQALQHGNVQSQWQPLTLQGAGLFHVAMGAIIGVSAYGRTQEKLGGANNGGLQLPSGAGTTYTPPGANATTTTNFGSPATSGFGGSSNGFNSTTSSGFGASPSGFGSSSSTGTTTFGATATAATTDPANGIATTASGKKIVPDFSQPLQ